VLIEKQTPGEWNDVDYFVMFGDPSRRSWEDARTWGYVAGGGAPRWSRPLRQLRRDHRVFVRHPGHGYVGVGRVLREVLPITDFVVEHDGRQVPILEVSLYNDHIKDDADDPERCEYVVPVRWEWTVPVGQGLRVKGLFSRRTTVAELRSPLTAHQVCEYAGIVQGKERGR
jgi:hypothetical protein